ncbi:MAG TPA: hypothetical protein VEK76_13650 [Candidatus Binatia bacterium]|nr:hypothetical protein [Candidatus Binatia bacterium]
MTEQAAPAPGRSRIGFVHVPHPRIHERAHEKPARTNDERVGINGRIGLFITTIVGTMWAAYLFVVIACIGAYAIIGNLSTLNLVVILISQTFLQLVLLPVIIVGQNLQARAADKRGEQTFKDAEAILNECLQLQAHLQAQDQVLEQLITAHRPEASSA